MYMYMYYVSICSLLVYVDEYSEVLSALVWLSLVYKSLDTTIPCKYITLYTCTCTCTHVFSLSPLLFYSLFCFLVDEWFSGKLFPSLQQPSPMLNKTDTSSLCHYDIEVGYMYMYM